MSDGGAALAARGAEIREQSGMPHGRALLAFFAAQPAVYLGRVEEARALAEAGLAASAEANDIGATLQNAAALGFLELFVTVNTVETHLTSVYAKLGVHSRSKLASVISS